jgi:Rad3-related DNA helicase
MDAKLFLSHVRGAFERVLPSFGLALRPGQARMALAVAEALAAGRRLAVEAGTGIGKSLAYLVPVMLAAAMAGVRTVVATRTRNLQAQLALRDALLAAEVAERLAGRRVRFAVFKGKANYLCPMLLERRLALLTGGGREPPAGGGAARTGPAAVAEGLVRRAPELRFLDRLAAWLDGGGGDLDDLPPWPDVPLDSGARQAALARVSAGDDGAVCRACPGEFAGRCPFQRARREAAAAHVVLANHSVVAADLRVRQASGGRAAALKGDPAPSVLVVDEAHEFEESVRAAFEVRVSPSGCARLASDFAELLDDAGRAAAAGAPPERRKAAAEDWLRARKAAEILRAELERAAEELFEAGRAALAAGGGEKVSLAPDGEAGRRVAEKARAFLAALNAFANSCAAWARSLLEFLPAAGGPEEEGADEDEPRPGVAAGEALEALERLRRLGKRKEELASAARRACLMEGHHLSGGNDAVWAERARGGVSFHAAPVDVRGILRAAWELYRGGAALTSATLFPGRGEEARAALLEGMALGPGAAALEVPSPFDYGRMARCVAVANAELDPDGDPARRAECLADAVVRIRNKVGGGVLVLFTSFREMRAVAELLRSRLDGDLLVQGEAGREELLERFRSHGRAVLLGADSFWQGVDVPGDALKAVVLARLPFPVPDDPIRAAKARLIAKEGGDPFLRLDLPACAVRLRQGFGRLIRSETDTGWVYVLDPRLTGAGRKPYRRRLQAALPVPVEEITVKF